MRFVFDTNVLVSALMISRSVPRQAWNKARSEGVILASAETLGELGEVLCRPKILAYVPRAESELFLADYRRLAEVVIVTARFQVSPDPKDDKFLDLALAGHADFLVTGDRRHLLSLGEYRSTRIITARELCERLPSQH